jgi:hypothetical protein
LEGQGENRNLVPGMKLYKQDLYFDFVQEYPDYGPKAKMTISRTKFYQWLVAYSLFKEGLEGRDSTGRWIIIKKAPKVDPQYKLIK